MRKYIYIFFIAAAALSCTKSALDIESGAVVGEVDVTAAAGSLIVSVETVGRWIVYEADGADWVSLDVPGGVGFGAFTITYESNMSSVIEVRPARKARIVVTSEDYAKSDTLNLIQQGFDSDIVSSAISPSPEIVFEYIEAPTKEFSIVYCSAEGVTDLAALSAWAESYDVVACGNGFLKPEASEQNDLYSVCTVDIVNFVSSDLYSVPQEEKYEVFKSIVDATYNAYNSPSMWVLGGQLYHLSMMQTQYPSTPSWYPADIEDPLFDSDRYAWNNNLYDCLWMSERKFVTTWTSGEESYMADYVYVSRDVLASIKGVRMLDKVHGMTHNPIMITIKYRADETDSNL